jgi:hypothetical protein
MACAQYALASTPLIQRPCFNILALKQLILALKQLIVLCIYVLLFKHDTKRQEPNMHVQNAKCMYKVQVRGLVYLDQS